MFLICLIRLDDKQFVQISRSFSLEDANGQVDSFIFKVVMQRTEFNFWCTVYYCQFSILTAVDHHEAVNPNAWHGFSIRCFLTGWIYSNSKIWGLISYFRMVGCFIASLNFVTYSNLSTLSKKLQQTWSRHRALYCIAWKHQDNDFFKTLSTTHTPKFNSIYSRFDYQRKYKVGVLKFQIITFTNWLAVWFKSVAGKKQVTQCPY